MRLLLLSTKDDTDYLPRFQRLAALAGHKVMNTATHFDNPVTLDRLCEAHKIEGIFCAQASTLKAILNDSADYIPPTTGIQITLDDYAGSFLRLRTGRPVVVLNPLERLRTVPHEKFVVDRYISKITQPKKWFPQTKFQWHEVTWENREDVMQDIRTADLCAIDIETPWPQVDRRIIDCVSYTTYHKKTHTTQSWVIPFDELWHWEFIREANDTETSKVFQNGLYDNAYFLRWGAPVRSWYYDTFHLFHSWLSELPKRLDFVASFAIREARFWKDDGKTGNRQDKYRYCGLDGWATINGLLGILAEAPKWAIDNYTNHEFKLVFPSMHAAMEGLMIDEKRFMEIKEEKKAKLAVAKARLQKLVAAPNYNPGSWQQNTALFKLLGCDDLVKSDELSERENARRGTGKIQTLKAKARHPLNNMILTEVEDYKKEVKQVGTYFDETKIWQGLALYSFNPGGTDTLRAASKESAFDCGWQIQNIPAQDQSFKECCLAPPGWFIGEADKAQAEARCVGYLSGELALINIVESDKDYHSWNASAFFGVPYEEIYDVVKRKTIKKVLRNLAKRTNHGANYNMGAEVMLDTMGPKMVAEAKITLGLPKYMRLVDVCQYLLDRYSATYPSVKGRWYQHIISTIATTQMLVSPFGWTRRFFGSPKDNKQHLNSAVAHSPQNLSVSIINIEWYKIWRETVYGSLRGRVRIKAQIHDSFLFIYKELADAQAVQDMMDTKVDVKGSDGVTRTMYIPSDLSTGKEPTRRWSEAKAD